MKILCYVRPWSYRQFRCLAENLKPDASLLFCSEHPKVDFSNLSSAYYKGLLDSNINSYLTDEERDDFIARCRLLRALERSEAIRHLTAMEQAVRELLARERPQVVLSVMVDSYLIDLLRLYCIRLEIKFIGIVPSFVNGFFRVTARGEINYNPGANVSAGADIKKALINPLYSPAFNSKSQARPLYNEVRRWAANIARVPFFFIKRHFLRDPYNYHYWAAQIVSSDLININPPSDPGDIFWVDKLKDCNKPILFIPLQMFPEATVDYWCSNIEVVNYYEVFDRFIERHSESFQLVVKEHPSVMGSRPRGFYRRLSLDKRIIVVPTYTPSNQVLTKSDGVVVWTGSVGFEAALRGKPVICLGDPYYAYGARFLKISPSTKSEVIASHIVATKSLDNSSCEQDELVSHLVSQLFFGFFKNDGTWSDLNDKDVSDCKNMAASLRCLLDL
jgi:hypothetical protein